MYSHAGAMNGKCLLRLLPLLFFPLLLSAQQTPSSASPPENSKAFSEGAAALQRGDLAAARAAFATAIRENPRNAKAANALGLVMLAQNDAASAIPQFAFALDYPMRPVRMIVGLASACLRGVYRAGCVSQYGAVGSISSSTDLAPFLVLAAFAPLGLVLGLRNVL